MVSQVSGLGNFAVTSAQERAKMSREQFLQILVEELTNQNPLDPMDNSQFLQQLVGLQSLEQTSALTDAMMTFERFVQMSSAAGLIGRSVRGVDINGNHVEGIVDRIVVEKGKVYLSVGPTIIPIHAVTEII